ncbi:MAG TPA: MG2 domain-containing protein [Kofleriaceae bacterium]|nr:MG2 domain-containing protein [Kofleriaceae bacterium]
MRHVLVLLVLCGLVACGGSKKVKGDLTVTATPTGEVTGPVKLVLAFSKPMVASAALGKPVAAPPVKFAPDLGGEARWQDDKTLVVVPTKSLPVSTRYVATVASSAKALDGSALGEAVTFEFFTERLAGAVEVIGAKRHATRDQLVKVTFNQEVPFSQVLEHCAYEAKDKRVKVKAAPEAGAGTGGVAEAVGERNDLSAPAKVFAVMPDGELTMDTDWVVACSAELRGAIGNLGPAEKLKDDFHTYGALKFVSLEPDADDIVPDEDLHLELAFSNPLKEPYKIQIRPAVPGFPERCYALGETTPGLRCAVQLEARTSYTITVDAAQEDLFGQKLGAAQTLDLRTTDANPTISLESGYFVAELKRPVLPLWTRNVQELQLRIVDVTPANFHELAPLLNWWEPEPIDLAKTKTKLKAHDVKLAVAGQKNLWGQRPIDPAAQLGRKAGPGMYYVEIGSTEVKRWPYEDGGRQKVLVNFTDIGVVSKLSPTRGLVWATRLSTGKPLPGAEVTVRDGSGKVTFTGVTNAEGVAILPGTGKLDRSGSGASSGAAEADGDEGGEESGRAGLRVFVAHQGDFTMVNPTQAGGLSPWAYNVSVDTSPGTTRLRGFMHTDRGLYRPGETVHVKGIARVTKLGEPLAVPGEGKKVKVVVDGPQGKTFTETEAKLSAFGGFWFDVALPGDARLGDYKVTAQLDQGTFTREFTVEAFRAATFEVNGKAKESRVVRRGTVSAKISANYFYGAPLRDGQVEVAVHSRPRQVEFPAFEDFRFQDERRYEAYYYGESEHSQTLVTEDHLTLDSEGNAALSVAVSPSDISTDADLLIRANVTSPANEVISKTFTVPYYRTRKYFGIKSPGYFLDVGKPQRFEIVGVSPDGKAVEGPAKVKVIRRDWNCVWEDWGYRGSYQCKEATETLVDKTLQLAAGVATPLEFTPVSGGDYWVIVEPEKDKDEASVAAVQVYAWGDGGGSWRSSDTLSFDIVADRKQYKVGDTATLILKTDLAQATGLVTIERDGVLEQRLIDVTPKNKHVTVPITSAHAPNIYVSVALVQGRMGEGNRGKPRMRMGLVNLPVQPEDNTLTVAVATDRQDYRPGDPVTATVKVTDKAGAPVSAEVSLTAADEGVLSLIAFATPNPVPTFYSPWGLGVTSATQLEFIRDIPGPNLERPATGGDAPGTVRSRFVSTAVWAPSAVTDAAGQATVKFAAPDNLTAFRVMAVAADKGYRFGSGDKRFTVSKPLQLHQSLPRFLSLGDELTGGVIVHNETGKAGTATVKLVSDARLTVTGGAERTVTLAKGARAPVLFTLTAAELGEATLKFSVSMGGERDAVEFKLPIQHPSPVQSQAVAHGTIKEATTIALTLPADAIPATAELVVSVDPDGLSGIDEGLRDLIGYPYGCLEQTTSKVIPMIAVRDLAESMSIAGLTGKKLEDFVQAGIAKIGRHQTAYGGFSLWPGGEPEAYYTAYALWGLHLARRAGYQVDQARIDDALGYLRNDAERPGEEHPYYSESGKLGSQAFALYVRAVLGDKDGPGPAATALLAKPALPLYGKAFAARALAAVTSPKDPAVVKLVGELAEAANLATAKDALVQEPLDFQGYMSSSLRTSAIVLAALVELDAKNPAIKPLVRAIMKHRRSTRYFDTQQNLYSLLALTSYARSVTGKPPSVAVALGDKQLFAGTLSGKSRMRSITVPLPAAASLVLQPTGEINYSVAIRHRRTPRSLQPESNGIVLTRAYLDEAGQPKTTFQVGDVVVVRVTTELTGDDEHLIVSEPLPAGFEALNTRLATVGDAGIKQSQQWGTYREMLDDRVNFASEWTYRGGYTYEFTMRATSVGKFARPPTVAELMYDPAVNARGGLDILEIKAK